MSDYATQQARDHGCDDDDDLTPAADVIEELAQDAARLIADSKTILPGDQVISVLKRTLNAVDALNHLYSKAKRSDQDHATRLLNQ